MEWRKIEEGIAVQPFNQPALEKIVKVSVHARDRMWNWLHEPKVFENSEERKKFRELVAIFMQEVAEIILRYGNSMQGQILLEALKNLQKGKRD